MAIPKEEPRFFTVEEANRLLPKVKRILSAIRQVRQEMWKLESELAVVELSWLKPDGSISSQAQSQVKQLRSLLGQNQETFEIELKKLEFIGAHLKDLDQGLVDFFSLRGQELVFLCWKDGEEEIGYWHDMETGFPGRQPLDQL